MTNVVVSYGAADPSHDISLSDGSTTYGLIFAAGPRILQESPLSPPAQAFESQQRNWLSGRGFLRLTDDRTGFFDSQHLWSTSDGKLFPVPQWRFASGLRTVNESLPDDNDNLGWWKLYGTADAASLVGRYLSRSFTSVAITADKAYLWIRRRGTPGTLTFELTANSAGDPGTVLQTVTKTTSDITDTVSVYQLFDWSGTESLSAATVYHVKIYGAATDSATNNWQVLTDTDGSDSKMSTAGSTWSAAGVSMYYRITDADTARRWFYFLLEGGLYAVDQKDNFGNSALFTNAVRGTATAGTSTTLTDSNLSMTTDQYADGYTRIRIIDGTGDGQDRLITANTATQFTISPAWDGTVNTTSRYIVYSTKYWNATTGTPGLGWVSGQPAVADKVVYFPRAGTSQVARRGYVNASSHTFADDVAGSTFQLLYMNSDPASGNVVVGANTPSSYIQNATPAAQGVNLSFGTAKYIGASNYRITNLFNYNGNLWIFKEDGPYILNGNRLERLTSGFNDIPGPTTGVAVAVQDSYLWWSWGHSVVRTIGRDSTDMLNFRAGYDGLPATRRGTIRAIVSAVGWTFFAVDGGADNVSSVLCWNGFGWHEVFRGWGTGVRIRNLFWQGNVNARGRLWIDVNGEMVYMDFPLFAANPLKDTTLNYHHEAVLVTSTIDGNDALLYKVLEDIKILLEQGTVEVDYQTNANVGTNNWTVLGTASTSPLSEITLNLGAVLEIRFRLRFQAAATRTPPIISGWMTNGRLAPTPKYQWVGTFKVSTDQDTKTSETDHDPNDLYTQLQTWFTNQTKLTLRTLSESSDNTTVTVSLPAKSVDWIDGTDWGGQISVVIMEV